MDDQSPASLPTSDEFFGTASRSDAAQDNTQNQLPTADEFFKPQEQSATSLTMGMLRAPSTYDAAGHYTPSEPVKAWMKGTSVGRIMDAFGTGAAEQLQGDIGMSPEAVADLRKAGIFNDYANGEFNFGKAITEGIATPAASALDIFFKGVGGGIMGTAAAGGQALEEVGVPGAAKGIPELAEMAMNSPFFEEPVSGFASKHLPTEIAEARHMAVIGEGEDGYFGTKEPNAADLAAREATTPAESSVSSETVQEKPNDIHTIARNLDPETFDKYDRFQATQESLRNDLAAAQSAKTADLDAQIKEIQDAKSGGYGKLQSLIAKRDEAAGGPDTPEMADIRQKLQQNDYAMRDLAPQVSAAYRSASEFAPEERAPPTVPEAQTPAPEATSEIRQPSAKPIEEQRQAIISDISQKLQAVGRPQEEIDAAAQLEAARYETLAAQYPKFSAEEWYSRESANIKAGREVAQKGRELAQAEGFADADTIKFRRELDALDKGEIPRGNILRLGQTPDIISKIGGNDGQLVISPAVVKKIEGGKHNISRTITARLKSLLQNPIAVFDSDTQKGDIIAAVSIKDKNGKQIIVPIRIGKGEEGANVITSVYGRSDDAWFQRQIDEGRLRYLNTKKASELPGLAEHNVPEVVAQKPNLSSGSSSLAERNVPEEVSQKPSNTILTEADFVNKDEQPTDLEQKSRGKIRLATDDAKSTITMMKSANASTLIHEKGHEWTDQLLRLSAEDDAPQQMKADADTLRKYGGAGEDGAIPTRGHEKIARGFERYLMEGTAPSPQLAGVFAKFRNWLTSIYKTVESLRSPISDDIRDVFDRLLSAKPEKTTIAPDHEPGAMLANIHAADAETTPPEKAAEVRDNIRSEVDKTALTHDKGVYDALKSAEKSAGEPEAASVTTGPGATTEPNAGETSPPQQSPEVNTGRNQAGSEGTGERATERISLREGSGEPNRTEPAGPNATFPKRESDLVDKAGNIRLDNLNTPEDINEVLRETAKTNGDFMAARRGVLSDAQVLDLADVLGMDPAFLDSRKIGQAYNAEQIMAARKLLVQSAQAVRDAAGETDTDAGIMAYAEAKARHSMIQEQVSGITAEAGRALRAFREIEGQGEAKAIGDFLQTATGKDLFQLKREADLLAKLDTPQKVSKFIHDLENGKLRNAVLEYYVNCLISGPITHMRYAVGNAINALWTPLVQIPVAVGIGKLRELATGAESTDKVHLGEAGAQLYAMTKGAREGLTAAGKAWETGQSPLLPVERIPSSFADVKSTAIPGMLGKIINTPGRSVAAIHSFFKSLRYEQNIAGLAYRQAASEGLEGGDLETRVAQLTKSPPPEMMQTATDTALKNLYMAPTDYHSAMGSLIRFTNTNMMAKIIIPFMKIGSQITGEAFLEQTPLGIFSKDIRENLLGANGGAARDFQAAKITAGIGLMSAMTLATAEGNATGDGPNDPKQRAVWLLNNTPNTLKIGNISIPYQGLGALGMLMRFSANMTETAHGWGSEDGDKLAISALEGLTKSVLDENFMRGVNNLFDAIYHPQEYGSRYVQDFVTNWLPFSVGQGQVARIIDPDRREVRSYGLENAWGIFDSARSKIPFLSEGLYPRRDVFGTPIPNSGNLQNYANDPVVRRLEALNTGIGPLEHKIRGVALNAQQFDAYSALAGRMTKQRLDMLVQPGFELATPQTQIEAIDKAISKSREAARAITMMQNPSIIRQAVDAKKSTVH